MSFNLSQVMADLESEGATIEEPNQRTTNKKRTLKRKPEPNLNKLKSSTVSAPPLSDSIYLDEQDAERETEQTESQRDEPTDHDYRLLGMGHPDNDFAEDKHTSPLLAQASAGELGTSGQYQQQYAPGYNQYQPAQQQPQQQQSPPQNDALLKKLNYMIHLLEEQKNEQTNNVTEELILYIFLGIFVIFVVDSFTKVGKYRR